MAESSAAASALPSNTSDAPAKSWRPLLIAVAVCAGLLLVAPFILDAYTINILVRALFLAVLALTVDLIWGYTGILTFGQSAFFGIGAYACALTFSHFGFGLGWAALALLIGILVAMAVGLMVGWLAFYHGASPLYASIVTLALPIVLTQVIYSGGNFTGSSSGLSGFPTVYWDFSVWLWLAGGLLIVVTLLAWIFVHSDCGRALVAVRENENRCAYLGIPVSKIKIILFVVMGGIGAVAGFGYATFSNVVAPELTGFLLGTELLIWVALGGRGTVLGPVIGVIIIEVASAYLAGSLPFVWKLCIGVAFVAVIVLLPEGLLPVVVKTWRKAIGKSSPTVVAPELVALEPRDRADHHGASLEVDNVYRHFGSLKVLQGIEFHVGTGELVSLVGPNGAGKTTLIRCLADGLERSGGHIKILGKNLGKSPPAQCVALGIGRKFQKANVFETLTVAQCLRMARYRINPLPLWHSDNRIQLPASAIRIVEETGLQNHLNTEARNLSHGLKQALELAMVFALEPHIVLLDEPTAGLTKPERNRIGSILTELTRGAGLSILLVEHDLDFVREISSRVIVLHQGKIVLDGSVDEVVNSELVREVYAGAH